MEPRKKGKKSENNNAKDRKESKPRWCRICLAHKPPRSHHCSYCGRCILKMDHHCESDKPIDVILCF